MDSTPEIDALFMLIERDVINSLVTFSLRCCIQLDQPVPGSAKMFLWTNDGG